MAENNVVGNLFGEAGGDINLPPIDESSVSTHNKLSPDEMDSILGSLQQMMPVPQPKPMDIGGSIGAAAYGLVNEPTLGLAGAALKHVAPSVYDKAEEARAEHPGFYTAGGVGGFIGAAALTGGASTAAETVGAGAGALGEAGAESITSQLAKMIPSNVVGQVGEAATAKLAPGVVKGAVQGAVEGSAFSAGSALINDVVVNHDKTATDVIADMGHEGLTGLLLGGTIGAALPGIGRIATETAGSPKTLIESEAGQKIKDLYFKIVKKAGNLTDQENELAQNAATSAYNGVDLRDQLKENINNASEKVKTTTNAYSEAKELQKETIQSIKDAQDKIKEQHESSTVQWHTFLDDTNKQTNKMVKDLYAYMDQNIPSWTKNLDVDDIKSVYTRTNDDGSAGGLLIDVLADLATQPNPNLLKQGVVNAFKERVEVALKKLEGTEAPEDAFKVINKLKQDVNNDIRSYGRPQSYEEKATNDLIRKNMKSISDSLEDNTIWGQAGDFQAGLNSAYRDWITADADMKKSFGKKLLESTKKDDWQQGLKWNVNFKKVQSWIKGQKDPLAVQELDNIVVNWNNRISGLNDFAKQYLTNHSPTNDALTQYLGNLSNTKQSFQQLNKLQDQIQDLKINFGQTEKEAINNAKIELADARVKHGEYMQMERKVNELSPFGSLGKGLGDAGLLYGIGHGASGLSKGAGILMDIGGALKVAQGIIYASKNPVRLAKSISSIAKASEKVNVFLENAVKAAMGNKAAIGAIRKGVILGAREYDKVAKSLSKSPEMMLSRVITDTAGYNEHNNDVVDTVRQKYVAGYQFLRDKLPKDPKGNVLTRPSPLDLARFNRYYSAITNPLASVENFAKHRISTEEIEAIKTVYPSLYEQLSTKVVAASKSIELNGKQKALFNKWIGQPSGTTQTIQSVYSKGQNDSGGGKKPSVSGKSNMIKQSQTATEKIAEKLG